MQRTVTDDRLDPSLCRTMANMVCRLDLTFDDKEQIAAQLRAAADLHASLEAQFERSYEEYCDKLEATMRHVVGQRDVLRAQLAERKTLTADEVQSMVEQAAMASAPAGLDSLKITERALDAKVIGIRLAEKLAGRPISGPAVAPLTEPQIRETVREVLSFATGLNASMIEVLVEAITGELTSRAAQAPVQTVGIGPIDARVIVRALELYEKTVLPRAELDAVVRIRAELTGTVTS